MTSSKNSAIALAIICLLATTSPVCAQISSDVEPMDEIGSQHSKIADIDIVTNSPTLQSQTPVQQLQTYGTNSAGSGISGSTSTGQQNGLAQYNNFSAGTSQYSTPAAPAPATVPAQNTSVAQSAPSQPIQIDSQTVGRVVGVAGTALILGAFLKNGGVGGMMNSFGLDNRFHGRGPSLAPY